MECTRKLEEVKGKRYDDLEAVKLRNMVDMALGFSAMMRLNLCPALTPRHPYLPSSSILLFLLFQGMMYI